MLNSPIRYLKGVGPKKEVLLKNLGIHTLRDLLYYFPFRYQDRRNFKKIKDLNEDEASLIKGKVLAKNHRRIPFYVTKTKIRSIFEIVVEDDTARVGCVWFNQPYLSDLINAGEEIIIYGRPSLKRSKSSKLKDSNPAIFNFNSPEYELIKKGDSLNLGRIVGFYHLTAGLNQNFMRKIIYSALEKDKVGLADPLPFDIRKEKNIPNIVKCLEGIHFPQGWYDAEAARERFIFEELFYSQILVYLRKAQYRLKEGIALKVNETLIGKIKANLAFELTASQEEALSKIISDLGSFYPMHRLLQGDVGCGKTVVAAFAIGICIDNGYQGALMVPTEVLAYQHKETLAKVFKGLDFKIEILVSSLAKSKIKSIHKQLAEGKINLIIGTHSLVQEEVAFNKLGLAVIDEQHKFGVAQRALLPKKGKQPIHYLVMSATPIPRSLALTLYGDLDLLVINELPKGRVLAKTIWVKEGKRIWAYDFIKERLKEGRQAYIIYPVIEESEQADLKSLKKTYQKVCSEFKPYRVGMFYGGLKPKEKLEVIKKFVAKKIDILVATTVIEVGVNIENATIMVVESPQRFGLAQLHQLRGRIQRSGYQPYFILISSGNPSALALSRLKAIASQTDGFKIAEEDLKLRGPGDFFGFSQHGFPELKIADPLKDLELLGEARIFAYRVIKNDPYLEKLPYRCIKENISSDLLEAVTVSPAKEGSPDKK